jgi:23S rRNA (uracil1939-C5)-methyltransferase
MPVAIIESLDHEGRGVAHVEGKVIFIEGALPREKVEFSSYRKRSSFEQASLSRVLHASAQRAEPACKFYGICGGCSMQHAEVGAQVAAKQRVLEDALKRIAKVSVGSIYPAIYGPAWGYRSRARIGVRSIPKKGGVLVGFHEKKSSYIADMTSCEILPPKVSALLPALRVLIGQLSAPDRIPQVELAMGDRIVLALRNLLPFSKKDIALLLAFGEQHGICMWQQPGGPETVMPLRADESRFLEYTLPEFDLRLQFRPTDFTQVNVDINRLLIRRAMQLLDPQPGERIADLFCGLGNFSLPIARRGAHVIGVEGSQALVSRAAENAALNNLSDRSEFQVANLFDATPQSLRALGPLDKMLIDPPREGAVSVVKALDEHSPRRIVYVSCNPATLARDAAILVHDKGYVMRGAGVANMFPHTSHVESIALFERI